MVDDRCNPTRGTHRGTRTATERVHEPALSPDTVYGVLADRDRRTVLRYLRRCGENAGTFEALVAHLLEEEVESDDRDEASVAARLHHATLPALAGVGLLEWDPRSADVRYRGSPAIEACLDHLAGVDDRVTME